MSGKFYKVPVNLMEATGFMSQTTGEPVELTAVDKLILIYMYDKTTFFTKDGGSHFETQVTIGNAVGHEWKAAARSLKKLYDGGVIEADKPRSNGNKGWVYKSVNIDVQFFSTKRVQKEFKISVDTDSDSDTIDHIEYDESFLATIQWE